MEQNNKNRFELDENDKVFLQNENNKEETKKKKDKINIIQSYFYVTQVIFNVLTPAIIGWIIGMEINHDQVWVRGLGALIGSIIGIIIDVIFLTKYYKKMMGKNKNDSQKK